MLALDGHIVSHILLYDHNRFQLHCSWGETAGHLNWLENITRASVNMVIELKSFKIYKFCRL